MIKVTELQIGDYLRINRDRLCIKKDTIIEVRGIDANNTFEDHIGCAICRPLDDMQYEGGIWCDFLDPIPLTAEILEKNGFEFGHTAREEDFCSVVGCGYPEEKGWCYDEGAGEIKIVFPNDTDGGLVMLDDECGNRHIEFNYAEPIMVHDLQHALRLCGIEKEIQL